MIRRLCALFALVVFLAGSVLASHSKSPAVEKTAVIKQQIVTPFVMTPFFVADRPSTSWETIIWGAEAVPGYKQAVEARCNSPSGETNQQH